MRTFDRIMIVVLALGVWVLVLKPDVLLAHGDYHDHDYANSHHDYVESGHKHNSRLSGTAYIDNSNPGVGAIYDWGGVSVICN